jgi:fermentation-respiration switch protein FrsA (DUF1100 family)
MFEPFPGNYVWNLATNLALVCGGNHGEIDEACRPIREAAKAGADAGSALMFDSWIAVADQVAANADADWAEGYALSAGTKYLRASGYYLAAERMQARDYAPRWAAYARGLELYHKGSALRGLHVDKVEIPYEGASYTAIFVHDGSGTPRPTLVSVNGLDSMKEQVNMAGHGLSNLERGMNTLFLDQPGTGEAIRLRGLPAVYDAERWGSPAFDYLLTRSDYWDHVLWVFGMTDRAAFLDYADQITLNEQVEKIRVPFLITHGENDRQIPAFNAQLSYDQAINSPKRHLRMFTKADYEVEHCGADNGTGMRDYIADWCAATFAEMG